MDNESESNNYKKHTKQSLISENKLNYKDNYYVNTVKSNKSLNTNQKLKLENNVKKSFNSSLHNNVHFNVDNPKVDYLNSINRNFLGFTKPIPSSNNTPTVNNDKMIYNDADNNIDNNSNLNNRNSISNPINNSNQGKIVRGIQPLYNYNTNSLRDENHREELTRRKFDEINESLDQFRTDMINTMRRINKQQAKLKIDTVIEEMDTFKNDFIDNLIKAERKREEENDQVLREMKGLRSEIERNYNEGKNNYKVIRAFQDEIFEFEKEITSRIQWMEKNQNEQFEKIYGLIQNMTILGTSNGKENNMKDLTEKVKKSKEDDKLLDELDKHQKENEVMLEESLPLNRWRTTNLKDKYILQRHKGIVKDLLEIKKKIAKASNVRITTSKQKLKSYLIVGYFISKANSLTRESNFKVKYESLTFFVNFTKTVLIELEDWVRRICLPAIDSIRTSEGLNLDMSEIVNTNTDESKSLFLKLKVRIEAIISPMLENISKDGLDITVLTWLRLSFSSYRVIPFGFYYNFVLNRIRTLNGELVYVDQKHIFLIMTFTIFILILVSKIFLSEMKSSNASIRNNFRMIASVFYYEVINFYKKKMKIYNFLSNYLSYVNNQLKEEVILNPVFNPLSNMNFKEAMKKLYKKIENSINSERISSRELVISVLNEYHNITRDGNNDSVAELNSFLLTEKQMKTYFKHCEIQGFDLMEQINVFINEFIDRILEYKIKK